jgi:tetratricopeptide (TPR) repeat protein
MGSGGSNRRKPHGIRPAPSMRVERNGGPFGISVLAEPEEPLSFALWLSLRFISLWAGCPPERRWRLGQRSRDARNELWAFSLQQAPELKVALECFAKLIRKPSSVLNPEVASGCEAVHLWAHERGFRDTALHFAEAAAFADPDDPRFANIAGAACRRVGLMNRAAIWIIRARSLAVGNVTEQIRSLLAMGALMKETGKYEEAERAFTRAARAATRKNRKRQAAEAHHDLLLLTAEQGRLDEAEQHAVLATDLYPLKHSRLPYLAHDLAFALVRFGYYSDALPLLEAFVRTVPPGQLLPGLSTLAWAAAGDGLVHRFTEVESRVVDLATLDHEYAPASFIHLAEGAWLLKLWERAEQHATAAVEAAAIRQDPSLLTEARTLVASIRRRDPPPASPSPIGRRLSRLSRHLTARLRRWKPNPEAGLEG